MRRHGPRRDVIACPAHPADRRVVQVAADGHETETRNPQQADVAALAARLRTIAEREGKTLAALNAGLFAGDLSDRVAQRVAAARRELADRVIRNYCLAKGIAVALNPIPVADLPPPRSTSPWSCIWEKYTDCR
jgi:hypothetical protein